jgi:hypothetical protein
VPDERGALPGPVSCRLRGRVNGSRLSLRSPSGLAPRDGGGRHDPEGATTLTIPESQTQLERSPPNPVRLRPTTQPVYTENRTLSAYAVGFTAGRTSVKRAPSLVVSAFALPPWASAASRTIARPSPAPGLPRAVSAR